MSRLRFSSAFLCCAPLFLSAHFAAAQTNNPGTNPNNTTARHPFSVEDLVRLNRVSDPVLSPDGKTVAFTVRETDMAANRGRTDLWSDRKSVV